MVSNGWSLIINNLLDHNITTTIIWSSPRPIGPGTRQNSAGRRGHQHLPTPSHPSNTPHHPHHNRLNMKIPFMQITPNIVKQDTNFNNKQGLLTLLFFHSHSIPWRSFKQESYFLQDLTFLRLESVQPRHC